MHNGFLLSHNIFHLGGKRNLILAILLQALIVSSIVVGQAYANAIFLSEYPADWLSYFFAAYAAASFVVGFIASPFLTAKASSRTTACILLFAFFIGSSHLLLSPGWRFTTFVLSLLVVTSTALAGAFGWGAIGDAFGIRDLKKYLIYIMFAGQLASIVCGLVLFFLTGIFGPILLLYYVIAAMLISSLLVLFIRGIKEPEPANSDKTSIFRYPVIINIFLITILTTTALVYAQYLFRAEMAADLSEQEIGAFTLLFTSISITGGMVLQLGKNKVLRVFGVAGLMILPAIYWIFTASSYIAYASLWTAVMIAAGSNLVTYNLYMSGREMVMNVLPRRVKNLGQARIKSMGKPVGMIAASAVIWLCTNFHADFMIPIVIVLTAIVLVVLISFINKLYRRTIRDQVLSKSFSFATDYQENNIEIIESLIKEIFKGKDESLITYAFSLLNPEIIKKMPLAVCDYVADGSKDLRGIAIAKIREYQDKRAVDVLTERLEIESDNEIIWNLLVAIAELEPKSIVGVVKNKFVKHDDPDIKAAANLILTKSRLHKEKSKAMTVINSMVKSDSYKERAAVAKVVYLLAQEERAKLHKKLLADKSKEVVIAALKTVTADELSLNDDILAKLFQHDTFIYAVHAAVVIGPSFIAGLMSNYEQNQEKYGRATVMVLSAMPYPEAEERLVSLGFSASILVRNLAARESAFRAVNIAMSMENVVKIKSLIAIDIAVIEKIKIALAAEDVKLVAELKARYYLILKRIMYWYACIATKPDAILQLVPALFPRVGEQMKPGIFQKSLEYIELYAADENVASSILHAFDISAVADLAANVQDIEDSWLQRVFAPRKEHNMKTALLLREVGPFKNLPGEVLFFLARKLVIRELAPGNSIFHQDDKPDNFYVVFSGTVNIVRDGKVLTKLHKGDFFGELALLDANPRTASAIAASKCKLLVLAKDIFADVVNDYPEVLQGLVAYIMGYVRFNLG